MSLFPWKWNAGIRNPVSGKLEFRPRFKLWSAACRSPFKSAAIQCTNPRIIKTREWEVMPSGTSSWSALYTTSYAFFSSPVIWYPRARRQLAKVVHSMPGELDFSETAARVWRHSHHLHLYSTKKHSRRRTRLACFSMLRTFLMTYWRLANFNQFNAI